MVRTVDPTKTPEDVRPGGRTRAVIDGWGFACGRSAVAEPLRRDVLETAERVLPAGDRRILAYQSAYGACLTSLERYPEAKEHLLGAYEGFNELPRQEEHRTRSESPSEPAIAIKRSASATLMPSTK